MSTSASLEAALIGLDHERMTITMQIAELRKRLVIRGGAPLGMEKPEQTAPVIGGRTEEDRRSAEEEMGSDKEIEILKTN